MVEEKRPSLVAVGRVTVRVAINEVVPLHSAVVSRSGEIVLLLRECCKCGRSAASVGVRAAVA